MEQGKLNLKIICNCDHDVDGHDDDDDDNDGVVVIIIIIIIISLSPLCRVTIHIFLRQTMSLGDTFFFSPGATTPNVGCILQPSSGL